jgi:hypothetical protein
MSTGFFGLDIPYDLLFELMDASMNLPLPETALLFTENL